MLKLALIQLYGGYCFQCMVEDPNTAVEDTDILQFAHLHGKPTGLNGAGRGSYERLKDVFDHRDSYVLLCADHHKEYDREK